MFKRLFNMFGAKPKKIVEENSPLHVVKEEKPQEMKQAIFRVARDLYREQTTMGIMYNPDMSLFGYTLEDTIRAFGIKDKHNTAIPATEGDFTYKLGIRNSPKYGEVVVIYTDKIGEDLYRLEYGGISFEQILIHGGNTEKDTSGCVLIAKSRNADIMTIQGSLKVEFKDKVKQFISEGYDCRLRITNLSQKE